MEATVLVLMYVIAKELDMVDSNVNLKLMNVNLLIHLHVIH